MFNAAHPHCVTALGPISTPVRFSTVQMPLQHSGTPAAGATIIKTCTFCDQKIPETHSLPGGPEMKS